MVDVTPSTTGQRTARRLMQRLRPFQVIGIVLLIAAAILPLFGSVFYIRLAIEAMLLGLLALGIDILLGYAGLLTLGHAAFFGLGAYFSALSLLHVTSSIWLAFAITLGAVTVAAAAIGAIVVRLQGVYFALVTLAVAEVLRKVIFNTPALGGSDGILRIPTPEIPLLVASIPLTNNIAFYYVVLTLVAGMCILTRRLLSTPFGSVLAAIRTNEARLGYVGYNAFWYKCFAFVLSAQMAAIGGFFYPILRGFVSPELLGFELSTKAVIMGLIGGLGTIIGPVFGSGLLTGAEIFLARLTSHYLIVLGFIFILFVIFRPQGLFGGIIPPAAAGETRERRR